MQQAYRFPIKRVHGGVAGGAEGTEWVLRSSNGTDGTRWYLHATLQHTLAPLLQHSVVAE